MSTEDASGVGNIAGPIRGDLGGDLGGEISEEQEQRKGKQSLNVNGVLRT